MNLTSEETKAGRFVVFEGGEGAGKSTQAHLLAAALRRAGKSVLLCREPGGPPGAELLRHLLLNAPPPGGWEALSQALLHYAARAEHLTKTIVPALSAGSWVVCDRFADSTEAYQGAGMAVSPEAQAVLRRLVVGDAEPDLVLVLDLDPAVGLARTRLRPDKPDHYERMEPAFHQRVRTAFLEIACRGGDRYVSIDAADAPEAVQKAVLAAIEARLGLRLGA